MREREREMERERERMREREKKIDRERKKDTLDLITVDLFIIPQGQNNISEQKSKSYKIL